MGTSRLVRHHELIDLLVIDRNTTDEMGRVECLWMHPPAHRVLGFICKSGPLTGQKYAFSLKQIFQLGPESIVTQSQPTATTTSEVQLLESLIGLEVWSDSGARIGKITDCLFELRTGQITQYLFRSDGWRGFAQGLYLLPAGKIHRFGKKRVFVDNSLTRHADRYQDGVVEKVVKVRDRIQNSYTDITHQAADQLSQATHSATQQVHSLTEQASQRVQTVSQQLTHETQALAQSAQERSQTWLEHLQARAQALTTELRTEAVPFTTPQPTETHSPSDPQQTAPPSPAPEDWTMGLEDVPLEDLETDEPWI